MPQPQDVQILVVDDNEAKRYSVVRILRQAGFHVLEACTGEEALRLAANRPDLMILDVKLPGISGFDVCRRIKADPELAGIKILHVSATYVDSDHRVEGLAHGADGYLVQPVNPSELVETVRALLRLREAEQATRRTAREWRATFDAVSNGILLLDEHGTVLRCNLAMAQIIGKPFQDIVGAACAQALPAPLEAAIVAALSENTPAGSGDSPELSLQSRQYQVTTNRVLGDRGEATGSVCVLIDITETKRLEAELRDRADELAAADRAKDEFLAMLAHELRNPLGAIGNAAALIAMKTDRYDSLRKPVEILNRQVKHTARLVDDLLDVSRITRGRLDLRRELLDLTEVARRAVEVSRSQMDDHRHNFTVSVPAGPFWLEGDASRLEQVIGNLLSNAAKYTDPGGHVALSLTGEDGSAVISVADDGQGIAPEMLERIFDLFAQEDRSLARSKGGLGIGLTLVKNLVAMHGGSVEARSRGPGCGSEFLVRLPLLAEDRASGSKQREPGGASSPLQILVVEDNVDAAVGLSDILRAWGHQVVVTHDGPMALAEAARQPPDVVLVDIGLPGMDGYELAGALRARKATATSRIVALTGYGQDADQRRSRAAGFDRHLVKPVDIDMLKAALAESARAH